MKRNRKIFKKIIAGISTLICCVIFVITSVLMSRSNVEPVDPNESVDLSIDLTQNNIPIAKMDFAWEDYDNDGNVDNYIFQGLKEKPAADENVLIIPSTHEGKPVTKVRPNSNAEMTTTYVEDVIAVQIPTSVSHIEKASFYGYVSVQYFESPFVGRFLDSTTQTEQDDPFASFFSSGIKSGVPSGPLSQQYLHSDILYDSTDNKKSVLNNWYDIIGDAGSSYGSTKYYVPYNLREIKITNEVALCNRAFTNLTTVEKITLPETLINLNAMYIFSGCTSLVEVTLPSQVSGIGIGAFSQCYKLKYISKGSNPNSNETDGSTVSQTNSGSTIINRLPDNLTTIPSGMFNECYELEEVALPVSLLYIESGAFYNCYSLKNLTVYNIDGYVSGKEQGFNLPNNLETIGASAFKSCSLFTSVVVPANVKQIGRAAFSGCYGINDLTIPFIGGKSGTSTLNTKEGVFGWIFGSGAEGFSIGNDNYNGSNEVSGSTPSGGLSITQYYNPNNSAASISYRIPTNLNSLKITNSPRIGTGALHGVSSVVSLTIGSGCSAIAPGSLNGMSSLSELVTTIAYSTARNNLGSLFGTSAYDNSYPVAQAGGTYQLPKSLKKINITNQPTIYSGTFNNCTQITDVTIGDNTTWIDEAIFYNCASLTNLVIPFIGLKRGVPQYTSYWYYWDNYDYYFYGPNRYMRFSLAHFFSSSTSASEEYRVGYSNWGGWYTRYIPKSLRTVEVTDDTTLHHSSFKNFSSLRVVKFRTGTLSSIEEGIFTGCYNLEEIEIPFIGQGYNAGGSNEDRFTLGWLFNNSPVQNSQGQYLTYQVGQYATSSLPKSLTKVKIGPKATNVSNYAFANCEYIKIIDFNETVTEGAPISSLGHYAFYNCKRLETLNMAGAYYKDVGNYAFYNCQMIYQVDRFVPSTVKTIGNYSFALTSINAVHLDKYTSIGEGAFASCFNLTNVLIPKTLEFIGPYTFNNCVNLKEAVIEENALVSKYMFKNCSSLVTCDLTNVTRTIPEGMFFGCSSIEIYDTLVNPTGGLKLDGAVEEIGAYAFAECYSIDTFIIPNTLSKLGTYAFSNTGLKTLTIPKTVTNIGPHLCHGNDPKFEYWVYFAESDWPSGWLYEWNCRFPAYIVGDTSEELFTYRYDEQLQAFIITGLETNAVLSDFLKLPATHFGIPVMGVENSNEAEKYINSQKDLSTVVIPSSYVLFGEDVFKVKYDPNPYNSNYDEYALKEIYVYVQKTEADMEDITTETLDSSGKYIKYNDYTEWSKWLPYGMIFTSEYWQYNTRVNNTYPYIRLDKLEVNLVTENIYLEYDGFAKTMEIKNIVVPGYSYGYTESNPNKLKKIVEEDTELMSMFTISYRNNILASNNAEHVINLNTDGLNDVNETRELNKSPILRFINEGVTKFTINKKRLVVYPALGLDENYDDKVYDELEWSNSIWGTSNVGGVDEDFVMTGKLVTKSANAGEYKAEYDWVTNSYVDGRNDFKWEVDYAIYFGSRNVTENFNVIIGQLRVVIERMDVIVQFTGGRFLEETEVDASGNSYNSYIANQTIYNLDGTVFTNNIYNRLYAFGYQGVLIEPEAVVYTFDSNGRPTILVENVTASVNVFAGPYIDINYGKTNINDMYKAEITLSSNVNHRLVVYDPLTNTKEVVKVSGDNYDSSISPSGWTKAAEYKSIIQYYYIEKGKVEILIDEEWTIGADDEYWSMTVVDFELLKGQFGLGPNSYIYGNLKTDGKSDITYVYNTKNSGVDNKIGWYWDGTETNRPSDLSLDFAIYNSQNALLDETDCYDVEFDIRIKIKYNLFEVDYLIFDNQNIPSVQSYTQSTDGSGNVVHRIVYDGGDAPNTFVAAVMNSILADDLVNGGWNYQVLYSYDATATKTEIPLVFDKIGTYAINVLISRENFYDYEYNVYIDFVRKDVVLSSLDKEYDGEPYDIVEHVISKAPAQEISYIYYDSNMNVLAEPPVYAGEYYVLLTVQYPGEYGIDCPNENLPTTFYFNNFQKLLRFEITKRQIVIDLNGWKYYDGNKVEYDLGTMASVQSRAVAGDTITGKLVSMSAIPDIYENDFNNWYWANPFAVFSIDTVKHPPIGDVTNNYEVVLINQYEIKNMIFNLLCKFDPVIYDGLPHQILFELYNTLPISGLNIKFVYGGMEINYNGANATSVSYNSFQFVDAGTYTVYVEVTAPYYDTFEEYIDVVINPAPITYKTDDYTWTDGVDTGKPVLFTGSPARTEIILDPVPFTEDYYRFALETVIDLPMLIGDLQIQYSYQGSNGWTYTEPMFKERGVYDIYFNITGSNYVTATGKFVLEISDDNLLDIDFLQILDVVEDYDWIDETSYHISVDITDPSIYAGLKYCNIYYSLDGIDWSVTNFEFNQAGVHTVFIKVVAYGYKVTVYEKTVTINAIDILYNEPLANADAIHPNQNIVIYNYNGFYDGKEHTIDIDGIGLNGNDYAYDNIHPTTDPDALSMYPNVTVYYTTNSYSWEYKLNVDWSTTIPTFSDFGTYNIYIKICAPNYNDLYLPYYGTVNITQATLYGTVEHEYNKIQYSGVGLVGDDIFISDTNEFGVIQKDGNGKSIESCHDGRRIIYFYYAHYDENTGIFTKDTNIAFAAPTELGYYYVEIICLETQNCERMENVVGYIQIVPREVTLKYDNIYEYDGNVHSPVILVGNTVGSDQVIVSYVPDGFDIADAYEVGTYGYYLVIFENGVSANYALPYDYITIEICKRKVNIKIDELFVPYKGDDKRFEYQTTDFIRDMETLDATYDESETDPTINSDEDIELTGSILNNNKHQHVLELSMNTLIGARNLYVYVPGQFFANMLNIDYKILENGVDVTNKYYEISFEASVNIGFTPIEVDLYPYTVKYYDGNYHTLYEDIPGGIYSVVESQGVAYDFIKFSEDVEADDNAWLDNPVKKLNAGTHLIAVWIHTDGRPEYKEYVELIIEPATLVVELSEPEYVDGCYDAAHHNLNYVVKAKSITPGETYEITGFHDVPYIKYYKTSEYDKDVLENFYKNNFDETDPLFNEGLDSYVDAGEYYAMAYFPEPSHGNYYPSLTTYTFLYEYRPIDLTITPPLTYATVYNGFKYKVVLTNPTFDEADLLNGHFIETYENVVVQTIAPTANNVGEYYEGATGFEFAQMVIYDEDGVNVAYNYKPIINDLKVYIEKALIIPGVNFYITDENYTKEYDNKINVPPIFTLSDGELNYIFYKILDDGTEEKLNYYPKEIGKYRVICQIAEGTNYKAYPLDPLDFNYEPKVMGIVTCTPRHATITWSNLTQVFSNQELKPYGTIEDVEGNIHEVELKILVSKTAENGEIVQTYANTARLAGQYYVYAYMPTSLAHVAENYNLEFSTENYRKIFTIEKKKFVIQVSGNWYTNESPWYKNVTIDMIDGLADLATTRYDANNNLVVGNIKLQSDQFGISPNENTYAILTTNSTAPGRYEGLGMFKWDIGIYSYETDNNGIIVEKTIMDITDSIEIDVEGVVNIYADDIYFEANNVQVEYTKMNHNLVEIGAIKMIYPTDPAKYTVYYKIIDSQGREVWTTTQPEIVEVGTYTVDFRVDYGTDQAYGTVNIDVIKTQSFITFTTDLNKEYDGIEVDLSTLSFVGLWNDDSSKGDLIFTFYTKEDRDNPLAEKPVNVGTYVLTVECKKDYELDPNTGNYLYDEFGERIPRDGNYTKLYQVIEFTISPKTINLTIEEDLQVLNKNVLDNGIDYLTGFINNNNHPDLISGDILKYSISAYQVLHGIVQYNNMLDIDSCDRRYDTTDTKTSLYKYEIYNNLDGYYITFEATIYRDNFVYEHAVDSSTNVTMYKDYTENYRIYLSFVFDVHYSYMSVTVGDVYKEYDGDHHSTLLDGTYEIALSVPTSVNPTGFVLQQLIHDTQFNQVRMEFSESGSSTDFYPVDITEIKPVIGRVIFYRVVQTEPVNDLTTIQYEDYYGSYKITIEYLEREISDVVFIEDSAGNSLSKKTYDGEAAGTEIIRDASTTLYMPIRFTVNRETLADGTDLSYLDYDYNTIYFLLATITYYKSGSGAAVDSILECGVYYYTIVIPESEYFAQTILTSGPITVEKSVIFIEDSVVAGTKLNYIHTYDTQKATFNAFNGPSNPYKIYTLDGDGNEVTINNLVIKGSIVTSDSVVGNYTGTSTGTKGFYIQWANANYAIEIDGVSQTKNYRLDIKKASITIAEAPMSYKVQTLKVDYFGGYYYPTATNINAGLPSDDQEIYLPSIIYSKPNLLKEIQYSDTGVEGTFTTTPIGFKNIGTYSIYIKMIADNYETTVQKVTFEIIKAQTYIRNVGNLSKIYDALEVLYPVLDKNLDGKVDSEFTNNTEVSFKDYIITYDQRNGADTSWISMGTDRPREVGKYQINIEIPSSDNFKGVIEHFTFYIYGYESSITWKTGSFVYNELQQTPKAYVGTINSDVVFLKYNYKRYNSDGSYTDLGNVVPHEVGTYIVSIEIDGETNYVLDSTQLTCAYRIEPRKVTVQLNANRYFNEAGQMFLYDDGNTVGSTYTLLNKVNGHKSDTSVIKTISPNVGIYKTFDNFKWCDLNMNDKDNIVIFDFNGNDVTHNYEILYDINVFITYSAIQYTKHDTVAEYDGFDHFISVDVDAVTGDDANINYTVTYASVYSDDPSKYRAEPIGYSQVGVYPVYFCVTMDVFNEGTGLYEPTSVFDVAYVTITQIYSNLELLHPNTNMNKVYDGQPVVNPEITYKNMENDPTGSLVSFEYYELSADAGGLITEKKLYSNPYKAGKYKLYIKLLGYGNYSDDELIIEFEITKRTLIITTTPQTKKYSTDSYGWTWELPTNYVMPNATPYQGLAPGEEIIGVIQTNSINVGNYTNPEDFSFQSIEPVIRKIDSGVETRNNYDIIKDLDVSITPGDIVVDYSSTTYVYTGAPRTIFLQVISPLINYTVKYSSDGVTWVNDIIYREEVGTTPVYFRVEAPNYQPIEIRTCAVTITGIDRLDPEGDDQANQLADLDVYLDGVVSPLDPTFKPENEGTYVIENVPTSTNEILFEYKTANPLATVEGYVNETWFDISVPYALDLANVDTYTFKINVSDIEGNTRIYQVMISSHSITLDSDNEISDIKIFDGTDITHLTDLFDNQFNPTYHGPYMLIVSDDVESVDVVVDAPLTSYVTINNATLTTKNIVLSKSSYTKVEVICTAQDGTKSLPYIIDIGYQDTPTTGDDDDNSLFSLQVKIDGVYQTTSPIFDPDKTGIYRIENVSSSSNIIEFNAIANSPNATVVITSETNGVAYSVDAQFTLDFVTNKINKFDITVTSANGADKIYRVWVSDEDIEDNIDSNNKINQIQVFDNDDSSHTTNLFTSYNHLNYGVYTIYVPATVNMVDIVVLTDNSSASALVNNTSAVSIPGHTGLHATVVMVEGIATIVTVQCYATDGTVGKVYTLNVVREGDIDDEVVNVGGVVYIPKFQYCGQPYMLNENPYFDGVPLSGQVVKYYLSTDSALSNPIDKPKDVGQYIFEITLLATSMYSEQKISMTFQIVRRKMDVEWDNLEFTYDGLYHKPEAYFTALDGNKVYLTVSPQQRLAGEYMATAEMPISSSYSTNYILNVDTIKSDWKIVPKPIEVPLIREDIVITYGEEMKVMDVNGNQYVIDDTGEVISIIDSNGVETPVSLEYTIHIDEDVDANGVNTTADTNYRHIITVVLKDKDNTIWSVANVPTDSNDIEFGYDIVPMILPNDDLGVKIDVVYQHIYTGSPIEPPLKVVMYNKSDNSVVYEFIIAESPLDEGEVDVVYADNVEVGLASITATSRGYDVHTSVDGFGNEYYYYSGNYSFKITAPFEIISAPPTLIELKANATIGFMSVEYDGSLFEINDGLATGAVVRDEAYKTNIYLGRLYQDQSVEKVVDQIANDKANIAVFDISGNQIQSSDWGSYLFGTGSKIVLYDGAWDANGDGVLDTGVKKIDEIEGILFGDTDGNGSINAIDYANLTMYMKGIGTDSYDTLGNLFASYLVKETKTVVNAIDYSTMVSFMKGYANSDFNINYKPISE